MQRDVMMAETQHVTPWAAGRLGGQKPRERGAVRWPPRAKAQKQLRASSRGWKPGWSPWGDAGYTMQLSKQKLNQAAGNIVSKSTPQPQLFLYQANLKRSISIGICEISTHLRLQPLIISPLFSQPVCALFPSSS